MGTKNSGSEKKDLGTEKVLESIDDEQFVELSDLELDAVSGGTLSFEQTGNDRIEVSIDP